MRRMTVDAERSPIHELMPADLRSARAIQVAAEAAANALLGRASGELCRRCEAVIRAYTAADEALLRYETLAATNVVKNAYAGIRALRPQQHWYARALTWRTRRNADRAREAADTAVVDRRILVTKTMSAHVTAWFQLHAALTELRAQAMHVVELALARIADLASQPLPPPAPLRDEQLGEAERIARFHGPDELRTRLKEADGSIKRQIRGDFGADAPTQPLDPED